MSCGWRRKRFELYLVSFLLYLLIDKISIYIISPSSPLPYIGWIEGRNPNCSTPSLISIYLSCELDFTLHTSHVSDSHYLLLFSLKLIPIKERSYVGVSSGGNPSKLFRSLLNPLDSDQLC